MKKISHQENVEYTYESEEERSEHINFMTMPINGWNVGSRSMRIKDGVHIMNATEEDYEWYAEFWRFPK